MKKIIIIFMSVLMIFSSCSMNIPYEDINENTETVEEPKEDNSENNTEEPSNEDNSENKEDEHFDEDDSENNEDEPSKDKSPKDEPKTCEIGEDTKILGLNYFVCVDNSQKKLRPSINDESQAKKVSFLARLSSLIDGLNFI